MIKKKKRDGQLHIDLTGSQGNAFFLLGTAQGLARKMGKSQAEVNKLIQEMKSGDYENLLKVFDREFGSFVTLYR